MKNEFWKEAFITAMGDLMKDRCYEIESKDGNSRMKEERLTPEQVADRAASYADAAWERMMKPD